MCGYFCIGFIDFMFKDKTLTDLTNVLSPIIVKNIIIITTDISCSLLVNPSHTDESWEGRNKCMWIIIIIIIIYIYTYIKIYYTFECNNALD